MNLDDHYRCYAAADFTVSSTTDKIMKVEITCVAKGEQFTAPLNALPRGTYIVNGITIVKQ